MWHQKPLLGSQINWGHPLAEGLYHSFILNELGSNVIGDLVTQSLTPIAGSIEWAGQDLDFGAGTGRFLPDDSKEAGVAFSKVSVFMSTKIDANWDFNNFSHQLGTHNEWWFRRDGGSQYEVFFDTGNEELGYGLFGNYSNKFYSIGFTYNASGNIKAYVDGKLYGSPIAAVSGNLTPTVNHLCIGGYYGNGTFNFEGKLRYLNIWYGRELTASDALWLHIEPNAMIHQPSKVKYYFVSAAGSTVVLTKVAITLTGKDISANAVNLLSKIAVIATGKFLGGNMSLVLPKDSLSLTGKDTIINKANTLAKVALSLTGKNVILNKISSLVKVAMTLTGKIVTPLTTGLITLVKVVMTMTGKVLTANKINALTKVAIIATGKSLFVNAVIVLTKVTMTLTGKSIVFNKLNNLIKETLVLTGKSFNILGGAVSRAAHRFFDFF